MACKTPTFRPEIEGLRAWAIGLVVLFHAGAGVLPGGFVGVDVFFVLSGYLIARLVIAELEDGSFSIAGFYARRVRRIVPAFAAMVLIVLAAGAVVALPTSLTRLADTALAATACLANVYFWNLSLNYFAPAADNAPLLHTWSLSLEEQFYLLLAPILIWAWRSWRRGLPWMVVLAALASFGLAQFGSRVAPTAAFYLLPPRAWELLAGVVLALNLVPAPRPGWPRESAILAGLGLVAGSALGLDQGVPFPGIATLPPVLGTALIVLAGRPQTRVGRALLMSRPIVMLGRLSYSLYLWHWPVLVFARQFVLQRPLAYPETLAALLLSLALAGLSFRLVEQPFRRARPNAASRPALAAGVALSGLCLLAAFGIRESRGLAFLHPRFRDVAIAPQLAEEAAAWRASRKGCMKGHAAEGIERGCEGGSGSGHAILLWGDSFARHYLPALEQRAEGLDGRGIVAAVTLQCPPILGYDPLNLPDCRRANEDALAVIAARGVDVVILAANWYNYLLVKRIGLADIAATVAALRARGLFVVVVGQSPVFAFADPEEAHYRARRSGAAVTRAVSAVDAGFNAKLAAAAGADLFFDPMPVLCEGGSCLIHDAARYTVRDYGHLTLAGARPLVAALLQQLAPRLAAAHGRERPARPSEGDRP